MNQQVARVVVLTFSILIVGALQALDACASDFERMPAWVSSRGINLLQPFGWGISSGNVYVTNPYLNGGTWLSVMPKERRSAIRNVGFDFVRLAIDPGPMLAANSDINLDSLIVQIATAVTDLEDSGLRVIVDIHVNGSHPVAGWSSIDLIDGPNGPKFQRLIHVEQRLAAALRETAPADVAFELFNEPPLWPAAATAWPVQQKALFDAVRKVLPNHSIIVTGANYSSLDAIQSVETSDYDANTVYSFHFYEPIQFSLQSSSEFFAKIHRLTFPPQDHVGGKQKAISDFEASGASASEILRFTKSHKTYGLDTYFDDPQDEEFIVSRIATVIAWARRNGLRKGQLLCGEFGSEGDHGGMAGATSESRAAYLKTVSRALEAANITWVVHELNSTSDGFGIASDKPPFGFDAAMIEALGLANIPNPLTNHGAIP